MAGVTGSHLTVRAKVFDLGAIGAATYGIAFIGEKTIDGLIDEFIADSQLTRGVVDATTRDIDQVGRELAKFFTKRLRDEAKRRRAPAKGGRWPLDFLVAGYDTKGIGRIREVRIPGTKAEDTGVGTARLGALWRGQTDVIRRLVEGVDWGGASAAKVSIPSALRNTLGGLQFQMNYPITLQHAVDLSAFVIRTTIETQRFTDGTYLVPGSIPGCGGPNQTLVITASGSRWIEPPRVVPGAGRPQSGNGG